MCAGHPRSLRGRSPGRQTWPNPKRKAGEQQLTQLKSAVGALWANQSSASWRKVASHQPRTRGSLRTSQKKQRREISGSGWEGMIGVGVGKRAYLTTEILLQGGAGRCPCLLPNHTEMFWRLKGVKHQWRMAPSWRPCSWYSGTSGGATSRNATHELTAAYWQAAYKPWWPAGRSTHLHRRMTTDKRWDAPCRFPFVWIVFPFGFR